MKLTIQAFIAGLVLGAIYSLLNLPIPAPPNLAGIMGIVGIYTGFLIVTQINNRNRRTSDSPK